MSQNNWPRLLSVFHYHSSMIYQMHHAPQPEAPNTLKIYNNSIALTHRISKTLSGVAIECPQNLGRE